MSELANCPNCEEQTTIVKLGNENPRQICPSIRCTWKGITLKNPNGGE
jgi:hypothetical protein